jgi:hypothetical protein
MVEVGIDTVLEWTWELETNVSRIQLSKASSTFFGTSPVIEDRISYVYPAMRDSLCFHHKKTFYKYR